MKTQLKKSSFSKYQLAIFILIFGVLGIIAIRSFAANPNLPGDINNDNKVNITDLSILLTNFGTTNATADLNGDSTVNITDLSTLLSHYGGSYVPVSGGLYGIPWQSDGLANLEIGKAAGRQVSIRFKAKKDETLTSARFYLIFRTAGYFAGNGGQVRVSLQTDSGGFPSGTTLAFNTITDPMGPSGGNGFPNIPINANLTAGQTYHLVFTNPASDPINNWVSLDDLSGTTSQPADPDLAITWKYSNSDPWVVNAGHVPIVELTFSDGTYYGQQYIDVRSSSGLVSIGSSTTATEYFVPSQNRTISRVYALTRSSGSPSPLIYTLYENSSQVATATVPASSVSASYAWVSAPLPYNLKSGISYKLTLSATNGTYNIYPYQKGTNYGFHDPFPDGSSSAGFDYPIYFSP